MKPTLRLPAFICGLLLACAATAQETDPFQHLEDPNDPRTQAFVAEQAAKARATLDRIPGRAALLARIRELSSGPPAVAHLAHAGTRIFYARGSTLYVREGLKGAEKRLLDAPLAWISPSPDGRHVAFGLAPGTGDVVIRVVAVDGAKLLPLEIDRARHNERLAWHPDGRAFYYVRAVEERGVRRDANLRVYRHVLGRPTPQDEIVFAAGVGGARDVPEYARPSLQVPPDSRYAYAVVHEGARREAAVHVAEQKELAAGKPRWRRLVAPADDVLAIETWKDDLYLLSKKGAQRHRVLRVKATAASLAEAKLVVPEGDSVIREMGIARDAIYLRTMVGGVDRLERVPMGLLGPKAPEYVRIPFDQSISQLVTNPRVDGALLRLEGWIEAPTVLQVDRRGDTQKTGIAPAPAADFSAMDEVRLYAPSHDGTKIPVTLVYKKSTTLTRENPTLLLAYGSHGVTYPATFDPARLAWLERGGIIAVAHVRGGGEYGEAWHEAGRRATKANTILDFIAVSEFVSRYGFTSPARLAAVAEGAGGIPVGNAMVRKPELFAAVALRDASLDMLRAELAPGGPANVPEFGSAATPEGRASLGAISAYHQVRDATAYPAVLLESLDAEHAWQGAKMAARLGAVSPPGKPVLFHAVPAARAEELADLYTFLLWQMGEPGFQPPPPPAPPPAPAAAPAPPPPPAEPPVAK